MSNKYNVHIEALLLYIILFLPGAAVGRFANPAEQFISFSISAEIVRILLYNIPSIALIWYLLLKTKQLKDWGVTFPGKKDLLPWLICLPALLVTGFIIATMSSAFGDKGQMAIIHPNTVPGWIIICISCFTTGYLEESYFRFYLLSRRKELYLSNTSALLFSTAVFSICHLYAGPWGFLNAVFAGIILCFIFLRYNSLHGIAFAHGLYNITAYIISAVF